VAAGKDECVTIDRAQLGDDAIGPRRDALDRFAARTTVAEQIPLRVALENLLGRQSFEVPVIPFDQVRIDDRALGEAGNLTSSPCALKRACEDRRETVSSKPNSEQLRILFAARRQREIRSTGVLAAE